ncbi:hypothetical protein LTR53_003670 [Teratosphaeriaceae sp. CCFEE 6253]|nr:hypothetical protein LTR53_003670 [Teratosphaeriaceae sp. CCFEE 6253]
MLPRSDAPDGFESYTWKVESLISVEQKRRPDATMESIKRAFRSMFKRKEKEERPQTSAQQQQQRPTTKPTPASAAQSPAAPPKDTPPQQPRAAAQPGPIGKLPPTHPLASRQHDKPQAAIAIGGAENAPIPAVTPGSMFPEQARREEQAPSALTPEKISTSEPVSAVSREAQPAPLPRMDGAADAVVAAPMEAAVAAPAVTESQPAHIQSTGDPLHPPTADSPIGTAQPNGVTPIETSPTSIHSNSAHFEDKIPVTDEEPPPIRAVRAAPGMSATSGPLEDFPEGGPYT